MRCGSAAGLDQLSPHAYTGADDLSRTPVRHHPGRSTRAGGARRGAEHQGKPDPPAARCWPAAGEVGDGSGRRKRRSGSAGGVGAADDGRARSGPPSQRCSGVSKPAAGSHDERRTRAPTSRSARQGADPRARLPPAAPRPWRVASAAARARRRLRGLCRISRRRARARRRGYAVQPIGAELEPPKLIVTVAADRVPAMAGAVPVPIRMGEELLAASFLVLVPFDAAPPRRGAP